MNIIERLENVSLFNGIKNDKTALQKIAAIIKIENYPANTYIIKEGESGNKMFILDRGKVRVEKSTLANDTYTVVNLTDDMNAFFGEIALMDNDVRSASVYTLTDSECYVIKKDDFDKLCENNNNIGYYIIKEIAKSLSVNLRKMTIDRANLIHALVNNDRDG